MKKLSLHKIGYAIGWFIGTFFIFPVRTAWNGLLNAVEAFGMGFIKGGWDDEGD